MNHRGTEARRNMGKQKRQDRRTVHLQGEGFALLQNRFSLLHAFSVISVSPWFNGGS